MNAIRCVSLIGLFLALCWLAGTASPGSAYDGAATYDWSPGVPNYDALAVLDAGTIDTSSLVMADFLGRSATQPSADGWGDSGVSVGWDDDFVLGVGDANTNGDALDGLWAQIYSQGWWDLGFATDRVVVFSSQDHGPYLGEGLEYRVYGSNSLWGTVSAQATVTHVYLDGWRAHNAAEDKNGNGWLSDDISAVFDLPGAYRYVKLVPWGGGTYYEPEIDAVAVPAPPAVGGIVEIQVGGAASAVDAAVDSSGGSWAGFYGALAGAAAAGAIALTAGALYARRHWLT